jgi:Ca2+-binding RTX toxin-like protein
MSHSTTTLTHTLVIFDSQVADLPLLYNALLPGSIAHTIQPHQDSIDTITHLLTETGATKLAIVAHGQAGAIQVGNGQIDRAMLETRSGLLQEWGVDSIALYSCEVGADAAFIKRFGELTGAQVSASTNKLGAGNWELDGGMALLEIDRLADYSGTLVTFTGTGGNDTASAVTVLGLPPIPPSIGTFTGGTVANLTDAIGDLFNAGGGDDSIIAGPGNDILNGGSGNDTLSGSNGDDTVNGDAANDTIYGGAGANTLNGGTGDDYIFSSSANDIVDGGTDNDFYVINTVATNVAVSFTAGNAGTVSINGAPTKSFQNIEQFYFTGGSGSDYVDAQSASMAITPRGNTFQALTLYGNGGNDGLYGAASDDYLDGGSDNDFLSGNAGNDTLKGGDGNDTLVGGDGSNILNGDGGDDRIDANYMRDTVDGGTGNDFLDIFTLVPTDAYTVIFTGANAGKFQINGADTGTFTGIEQLRFVGDSGNDVINANLANLSVTPFGTAAGYGTFGLNIYTLSGNDIVLGSAGKDFIDGGSGDDALYGQGGEDTIDGDGIFPNGAGFDTIFGGAGIDTLSGGGLNDQIFGGTENDIINGDDGEDYLYGEDGDDNIKGGYGFDIIYGQAGNDTIYGEGVTVDAAGNDTTVAPASGVGINDTIFGGLGIDTIYGGIGDDVLLGEEGNDFVYGGNGNDFVYGGIGGDFLYGEAGNDYIVGQDGNDALLGGDGSDYLSGDAGDDTIEGGNDNDFLYGNLGIDTIYGNAGNDFLDGGDGGDFLYGEDGIDTIFGVEGDDTIYGGAAEDYLYGGIGNDSIFGNTGTDFLIGGAGSDILTGGADSDKFVYFAMTDAGDTITDFDVSAAGDKLNLSGLFASIGVASGAVNTDYLKFFQAGADAIAQVDQDGTGTTYSFASIATLNNVNAATQLSIGFNVIV